jgi:hypothetical protein
MKVRRRVIAGEHLNDNTIENADRWHERPSLKSCSLPTPGTKRRQRSHPEPGA